MSVAHSVAMRLPQLAPQSDSLLKAKTMRMRLMGPNVWNGERKQQPHQERTTNAALRR